MSGTRHYTTDDTISSMRLKEISRSNDSGNDCRASRPGSHPDTNQFSLPHGNHKISSEHILNLGACLPLGASWLGSDRLRRILPSSADPSAVWSSSAIRLGLQSAKWSQLVHYGIASTIGVRSDLCAIVAALRNHLVV